MNHIIKKDFLLYSLISLITCLLISPFLEARLSALSLVISGSLIGGILGSTRLKPILLILVSFIAISYSVIALTPISKKLSHFFVIQDELPPKADAIIVLAAEWPLSHRIKSQGLERLIYAHRLLKNQAAPFLVVTEQPWFRGNPASDRAQLLGEELKQTIIIGPVENTFEEARAFKKLADERKWQNAILVTSPLHSKRAKAIFLEQSPGIEFFSRPAETREFDLNILISSYERLKVARLMFYEVAAWIKNIILGRV